MYAHLGGFSKLSLVVAALKEALSSGVLVKQQRGVLEKGRSPKETASYKWIFGVCSRGDARWPCNIATQVALELTCHVLHLSGSIPKATTEQ